MMKYSIFFVAIFLMVFNSCKESPSRANMNELEYFIKRNDLKIEDIEKLYEKIAQKSEDQPESYQNIDFWEKGPINDLGIESIDSILDGFYFTGDLENIDSHIALIQEFEDIIVNNNYNLEDFESLYEVGEGQTYFNISGYKYFPIADPFIKPSFKAKIRQLNINSKDEFLDSLNNHRLVNQRKFRNVKVDLEIKTKGFEHFNIPHLIGYRLPFNNNYFHDSILIIPDTLVFYSDVIAAFDETHYEIDFKINGKSKKVKSPIVYREFRLIEKIPLDEFFNSTYYRSNE